MSDNLKPRPKQNTHGKFTSFLWLAISTINGILFIEVMFTGALFYHLFHLIGGKEHHFRPGKEETHNGYTPRANYPNTRKLRITRDLRYYARELGADLNEYTIITEDGYVLPLHRLIYPNETEEERARRKPILMQHGLLSSGGCYLSNGQNSLAFYFLEMGYDVWLGNNRSNFMARHATFEGNLMYSEKYWDWDVRDLAYYDLPCIMDNVLAHKPHHDKLVLMGHSQGCTQSFLMFKNKNLSKYHDMVEMFFPLAPAIFPGVLFHERRFIKFIHSKGKLSYKLIFGMASFLRPLGDLRKWIGTTRLFHICTYMMFKYLFGWRSNKWSKDRRVRHVNELFNVSFVLAKLMNWWLSHYVEEGFSNQVLPHEDYRNGNHYKWVDPATASPTKSFFPYTVPWLEHISFPITVFTGDVDFLVDGKRLISHMRFYEPSYVEGNNLKVVEINDYDHCDVVWSQDCVGKIGVVVHKTISSAPSMVSEEVYEEAKEELDHGAIGEAESKTQSIDVEKKANRTSFAATGRIKHPSMRFGKENQPLEKSNEIPVAA